MRDVDSLIKDAGTIRKVLRLNPPVPATDIVE